jgi:hypothetical protein
VPVPATLARESPLGIFLPPARGKSIRLGGASASSAGKGHTHAMIDNCLRPTLYDLWSARG